MMLFKHSLALGIASPKSFDDTITLSYPQFYFFTIFIADRTVNVVVLTVR
jgi:hypothetical protein